MKIDVSLGVLDHQLVDSDGVNCGKVDDLELGGLDGDSPEVVAILVGGNAWRERGRLGRLVARLGGDAVHVPWAEVESVTSVVTLGKPAQELRLNRGDPRWQRVVERIPSRRLHSARSSTGRS